MLFWKPVPGVNEVIFLATPHRGTRMADASFAQLGRKLVGLPASLLRFQERVLSAAIDALDGVKVSQTLVNRDRFPIPGGANLQGIRARSIRPRLDLPLRYWRPRPWGFSGKL